jgi:hypothetical protein
MYEEIITSKRNSVKQTTNVILQFSECNVTEWQQRIPVFAGSQRGNLFFDILYRCAEPTTIGKGRF